MDLATVIGLGLRTCDRGDSHDLGWWNIQWNFLSNPSAILLTMGGSMVATAYAPCRSMV